MIDIRYLNYIPLSKRDEVYRSLVKDIYYFYYGIKPLPDEDIILLDENKWNMNKSNLIIKKIHQII